MTRVSISSSALAALSYTSWRIDGDGTLTRYLRPLANGFPLLLAASFTSLTVAWVIQTFSSVSGQIKNCGVLVRRDEDFWDLLLLLFFFFSDSDRDIIDGVVGTHNEGGVSEMAIESSVKQHRTPRRTREPTRSPARASKRERERYGQY